MSHAVAVVMAGSQLHMESMLTPYDEGLTVDVRKEECYCVNQDAMNRAAEYVQEKTGFSWAQAQAKFHAEHENELSDDGHNTLYMKMIYTPRKALEDEFLKTYHPVPNPNCSLCKGTGMEDINYNPAAKWDWWELMSDEYAKKRWGEYKLPMKPEDVDNKNCWIPGVIVSPFYGWQEDGVLGWWGIKTEEKDENVWKELYWKIFNESIAIGLKSFPIDFHI